MALHGLSLVLLTSLGCLPHETSLPGLRVWVSAGGSRSAASWTVCVDADAVLEVRPPGGRSFTRKLTTAEQGQVAQAIERLPKEEPGYQFGELIYDTNDYSILVQSGSEKHSYTLATPDRKDLCTPQMQAILLALAYFRRFVPDKRAVDPKEAYRECWQIANPG